MEILEDGSRIHPEGHVPVLARCVLATETTKGPVLELGIGYGSTLFLKELCRDRELWSLEGHKQWYEMFKPLETDKHKITYVEDWTKWQPPVDKFWDVVLIDHGNLGARGNTLGQFKDKAALIAVHDSEDGCYGYEPHLAKFKYRADYKLYYPWTTVVSDNIDVTKWDFPKPKGIFKGC